MIKEDIPPQTDNLQVPLSSSIEILKQPQKSPKLKESTHNELNPKQTHNIPRA